MRRLLSAAERLLEKPSLALAAGAAVLALLTLAALFQYRWIGEVSEAERQRLRAVLRDSTARFALVRGCRGLLRQSALPEKRDSC